MKTSTKHSLKIFFLAFTVIIQAFIISSCEQEDSPSLPSDPQPEGNSYLFTSSVSETHTKGSSPCPQTIAAISTFCGRNGSSCTADSVVITNTHPGLNAKFENNKPSTSLDSNPQASKTLKVEFNCAVPESISHKYKLVFYKNGTKVDEQELSVNVTVN